MKLATNFKSRRAAAAVEGPITRDEIKFLAVATRALDLYLKRIEDFYPIPGSRGDEE